MFQKRVHFILAAQFLLILPLLLLLPSAAGAQIPFPSLTVGVKDATGPEQVATGIQILVLLTILSLAPAILILLTSFTRIIIVFSFLRQAMGTQQMPPSQVLIGLALFLTFFIMSPIFSQINTSAVQPFLNEELSRDEAFTNALAPLRRFMLKQTREKDVAMFVNIAKLEKPKSRDEVPTHVLIPAFITSELRIAFQIGFMIYIPFLVIDMVVASVLMSMGMMMLPPIMISLPFKLMLFVLVDGWYLLVESIVRGFA